MDLSKINSETITTNVKHVVASVGGAAASGALIPFVPSHRKKLVRGALIVASLVVGAAHQGKSAKLKVGTSIAAGIAIRQGMDFLQEELKSKFAITDASSPGQKAMAGALGLACPGGCQGSWQSTLPALNMPQTYEAMWEEAPVEKGNSFA